MMLRKILDRIKQLKAWETDPDYSTIGSGWTEAKKEELSFLQDLVNDFQRSMVTDLLLINDKFFD